MAALLRGVVTNSTRFSPADESMRSDGAPSEEREQQDVHVPRDEHRDDEHVAPTGAARRRAGRAPNDVQSARAVAHHAKSALCSEEFNVEAAQRVAQPALIGDERERDFVAMHAPKTTSTAGVREWHVAPVTATFRACAEATKKSARSSRASRFITLSGSADLSATHRRIPPLLAPERRRPREGERSARARARRPWPLPLRLLKPRADGGFFACS